MIATAITPRQRVVALGWLAGLLSACTATQPSVDTGPVGAFRDTLGEVRAVADTALRAEEEAAYERLARSVSASGDFAALLLSSPPELAPFELKPQTEPLFQSLARARGELDQLHALLDAYANTLVRLAGGDNNTVFDAAGEAERLRERATALEASLETTLDIPDGAFFGFAELAAAYIETRRRDEFIALIETAQPSIAAYAELAAQRVTLSALGLKAEYNQAFSDSTRNAADLSDTRKLRLANDLLELNLATVDQLATLRDLDAAYRALPRLHASLATATRAGDLSIRELAEYLRSIRDRYRDFREVR